MRELLVVIGSLVALGCPSSPPASNANPGSLKSPSTSSAAPSGPLASGPVPGKSVPTATERSPAAAELTLLGEFPGRASVFPLKGQTFVACGATLSSLGDDGTLRNEVSLVRGLGLDATTLVPKEIVAMTGRWPEATWAATSEIAGNGNSVALRFFRWKADRWLPIGKTVESGGLENSVLFPWNDGLGVLAARAFAPTRAFSLPEKPASLPALTKATQTKDETEQYPCHHAMIAPEVALELAPGDVMVFSGQLCGVLEPKGAQPGEHRRALGFERLRDGEKSGELSLLPLSLAWPSDVNWNVDRAAALSPTDALVSARGSSEPHEADGPRQRFSYFAHWNGRAWEQEAPPGFEIARLWSAQGAYFATDETSRLWTKRSGSWLLVPWKPKPVGPAAADFRGKLTELTAGSPGTILLVSHEELPGAAVTSRLYRMTFEN